MRRYRIIEGGLIPHFVTWTLTEWVPLFISNPYCKIMTDSLSLCQREKGLLIHAYVIMPTHIHLILSVNGSVTLSDIMRDSKKFTSKEIVKQLQADGHRLFEWVFRDAAKKADRPEGTYKVWQEGTHPVAMESEMLMRQRTEYLHYNPVKKGLITAPEHWRTPALGSICLDRKGRSKLIHWSGRRRSGIANPSEAHPGWIANPARARAES